LIAEVAEEVGIEATIHTTDRLWRGQVEKRNFLIGEAAKESDWIVGVDADHVLHGIRYTTRHELEHLLKTDVYALDVDFYTPINYERPIEHTSAGDWHKDMAGEHLWVPAFCRVADEMQVEKYHWWYSGEIWGKRYWLWGGQQEYPHARASRLNAPFMVEHRCHFRDDKHIQANKEFCEDRISIVKKTGQEDHVDDTLG
jgi:hypothetical protein